MQALPDGVAERIEALLDGKRRLLGIAGAPGSGKSTLAALIAETYGPEVMVVPMDGFHLANVELARLGRAARKGAPDTFDAGGFVALLERLRHETGETVYAPLFRRDIEEPIANAIPVSPQARLIVTEGNYLLFGGIWAGVRKALDACWFMSANEVERDAWLLDRHIAFGRTPEAARAWIDTTDAPNARLIDETRSKADWVAHW